MRVEQTATPRIGTVLISSLIPVISILGVILVTRTDVKCFAFALDFPTALVSVAGILFVASNGFIFLMFLILLVVDGIESCCRRMSMCVILAMAEYIFAGLVVYAFVIRYELSGREGSINLVIQEYLIITALIMGVTTPWLLLLWAFDFG